MTQNPWERPVESEQPSFEQPDESQVSQTRPLDDAPPVSDPDSQQSGPEAVTAQETTEPPAAEADDVPPSESADTVEPDSVNDPQTVAGEPEAQSGSSFGNEPQADAAASKKRRVSFFNRRLP